MIGALATLLGLQLIGEMLAGWLKLPLPGGLIGMLLLLVWLLIRKRCDPAMHQTSQVLLQNLMLLFIPFIAGIVAQTDFIKAQWLPFVAACVLGAVVSLVVTAWTLQRMLKAADARGPKGDHTGA